MAILDPFTIDLSGEWYKDPSRLHYLNMYLHNLFQATTGGTGDSAFEDWSALVITDNTYEAKPFDYIEARADQIKLPPSPKANDQVIVSSDYDGNITVLGNGNNIKIKSEELSVIISQKGTSLNFIYFADSGYWRAI